MRRAMYIGGLAALLVAAACSKNAKKQADQAPAPVAPESVPVLAQIEMPSGQSLGAGAAAIDMIQPGFSAQAGVAMPGMLAQMAGAPGLDGADLDKPVRLVVLDPKKHPEPVVLAVAVDDADKLAQTVGKERVDVRGELALIGEGAAVEAARDYVLGTLAPRPAPDRPRGVAFTRPVLDSFQDDVQAFKAQMGAMMAMAGQSEQAAQLIPIYIDMLLAVLEQSEAVEVTLASHGDFAGAEVVLRPRAGTTLAKFAAAQKPTNFALLGQMPRAEDTFLLMTARLAAGPAREAFMTLGKQLMEMFFAGAAGEDMSAIIEPWMDLFEGEFAAWAPVPGQGGMRMSQVFTVSDSAKAVDYARRFGQAMAAREGGIEVMGMKQTISFQPEAFEHEGVAVAEQRTVTDLSSVEPQQRAAMEAMGSAEMTSYIAGFDEYMGVVVGEPDAMRLLIDAVRGTAPRLAAEGPLVRARDMARARKDSLLMLLDLGAMFSSMGVAPPNAPSAVALGMAFPGGKIDLFVGATR